jgi:glycosyltransferase involved in cell wall biosynthesis
MIRQAKRIALVSHTFDPFLRDGGSRDLLLRLRFLIERGCRVTILSFQTTDTRYRLVSDVPSVNLAELEVVREGTTCRGSLQGISFYQEMLPYGVLQTIKGQGSRAVMRQLKRHAPDYVITTDEDYLTLFSAWFSNIPGFHMFKAPVSTQRFAASGYARFLKGRTVFANSRFHQGRIRDLLNLESVLWYPLPTFGAYRVRRDKRRANRIGFSSTQGRAKGNEIITEIAQRMPERSFIVVGGRYDPRSSVSLKNVECWGHIPEMTRFYREIDLLLVPSLWEEAFARVILEAAVNGIPVIANRRGGISEALGDGGVLIDWDQSREPDINAIADQYVKTIRRILDDEDLYQRYSRKALTRSAEYEIEQTRMSHAIYEQYFC